MKKFYLMLGTLISFSVTLSSLSGCGSNGYTTSLPVNYSVSTVTSASPVAKKNCTCKKKTDTTTSNTDNSVVESPSPSSSVSPSESPSPSISPDEPDYSPTPLPSSSSSDKSKDKKNIFGNLIEKIKNLGNIFKKKS